MFLAAIKRNVPAIGGGVLFLGLVLAVIIHSYWRSHLPPVSIRDGMVLCRMKYCDFRFPLPAGARDVTIGPVSVGPDTINGSIFVGNSDSSISYVDMLRKHNFQWKLGSSLATSMDQPGGWVSPVAGGRIDFSYFGDR